MTIQERIQRDCGCASASERPGNRSIKGTWGKKSYQTISTLRRVSCLRDTEQASRQPRLQALTTCTHARALIRRFIRQPNSATCFAQRQSPPLAGKGCRWLGSRPIQPTSFLVHALGGPSSFTKS